MSEATLFDRPKEILITDPTTDDRDDNRLAGQNLKAYELLTLHGQLSNRELSNHFLDYRGRIRDIRAYLKERGYTVKCTRAEGGLAYYKIVKDK
jgi:hypothetical protein